MLQKKILSCLIQDNSLIDDSQIDVKHFTNPVHKLILAEMRALRQEDKAVDQVTLLERLYNKIENHDDLEYLTSLDGSSSVDNFDSYEKELIDQHIKQSTRQTIESYLSRDDLSTEELLNDLEKIQTDRDDEEGQPHDLYLKISDEPFNPNSEKKGITTGFMDLDIKTNGFHETELTVIAARPAMGKTALMMKFVYEALKRDAVPIVFSLEMSKEALIKRLIASELRVESRQMRNPNALDDKMKQQWIDFMGWLSSSNLNIYTRKRSIPEIRSTVRRVKRNYPDKKVMVFIDYLTLLETDKHFQSENYKVEYYSRSLKHMAMDFEIPVVTLAQLSRGVEQRNNKRPMLSDLRDSGAIEQDANNVMFLYRDAYYYPESTEDTNTLEIILAKQREGPTGTVKAFYNVNNGMMRDLR